MSYVAEWDKYLPTFRRLILLRESSGNYQVINSIGYVGGYQFGTLALQDLGLVKKGIGSSNSLLLDADNWTGKDGIKSLDDFLSNPSYQDECFDRYSIINRKRLYKFGVIDLDTSIEDVMGFVAASHLVGAGGVKVNGLDSVDANNTKAREYFDLVRNGIINDERYYD